MRRRRLAALAAAVPAALAVALLSAPAAHAAATDIRVNEVLSNDAGGGPDWFELTNTGAEAVDVSGWIVRDDDDAHELALPEGTVLEPGAFASFEPDTGATGFGLGKADAVRVFLADGVTLIDEISWTEHATSEGRLPDGTGAWTDLEPTRDAPNVARATAPSVVINEVESNGDARGDWVELANADTVQTADVSGWSIIDGDPAHEPIVLPVGTTIESGGYLGIVTDASFGLGGNDSVTVRDASGTIVAEYSWSEHAATTYGRCPDMTGDFAVTASGTFELVNECAAVEQPEVEVGPWPYAQEVVDAVAPGTWGEDMSGLDIDAEGTFFAVNNDNAEVFELAEEAGGSFRIAQSWIPGYPGGGGVPDAEGIAIAGDGAVFLSTERDNTAKGVSRPSVLRVELGEQGASTTTHEWNFTSVLGELGANAGLEGIEWIADTDATRLGVRDASGAAYDPAAYGEHFGGVFVVAVEQTGALHVVVLEADGGITVLQTAEPGVDVVMGLDWRAGGNTLWALCDEACGNRHDQLAFVDGVLTSIATVAPPAGMNPSFTNEGIALRWCEADAEGTPLVAWISDTDHDGVSLRTSPGSCATPGPSTPAPSTPVPSRTAPSTPVPSTPVPSTPAPSTPAPGASEAPEATSPAGGAPAPGSGGGTSSLPRTGGEPLLGVGVAALALLALGAGLAVRKRV